MPRLDEDFVFEVLEAVAEIPRGKVATYGQIAALMGRERNARLVGKALQVSELYGGSYPCHRVVNSAGRLVPGWAKQEELLKGEGILFNSTGNVKMKICQWKPEI